jgi:hypothetical protein
VAHVAAAIHAGAVAVWQRTTAIWERNRAIAERVAAKSAALLEVDPSLAMQLAVAAYDATVLLWDVEGLRRTHPVTGFAQLTPVPGLPMHHGRTVAGLAFTGDGQRLVTGSYDSTGRVWEINQPGNPRESVRLSGARSAVESVDLDQDGSIVVSGTDDARLIASSLEPRTVRNWICGMAGSRITPDEWRRYLPERPYEPPCN